jgi:peptidoglycan/xylan/chitin deacetylase (PgdA/CDA1 family)
VVLTFDDGPWPKNTPAVLAALAAHCTKAIFFPIGLHATYEPGILKQVAAAGHVIGSHTWCHQDLSKTKGRCNVNGKVQTVEYNPKDEIEMGISAVHLADRLRPISASRRCGNRKSSSTISASAISRSSRPTWIRSTSKCASLSRSGSP